MLLYRLTQSPVFKTNVNQGAEHDTHARGADHTHGSGAKFAQDPLSLPIGPITRLRAKQFNEALNGLIKENWADSKKVKTKWAQMIIKA